MKRFFYSIFALVAFVSFSNIAAAQTNSGTTPAIGTSHSYWVNSSDGTTGKFDTEGHKGNDFQWYITKSDLVGAVPAGDLSITSPVKTYVNGATAVTDMFKVDIDWHAPSVKGVYYLHIIETATNGCTNHKVERIQPFSDFKLLVNNINNLTTEADEADNMTVCANDVTPVLIDTKGTAGDLSDDEIRYNYGVKKLYYKITAQNFDKTQANFKFDYNIDITDGPTTFSASWGTIAGGTYTKVADLTFTDGTDATVNIDGIAAAVNKTFYVVVTLDYNQGDATFNAPFEGTAVHDCVFTLKGASQAAGNAIAALPADADRKQIVNPRPSTSVISSN
ncbi:MAG: hypothetical protein N4A49_00405 [Marinifilaceae bacterium]|jgi:hypothetical protein|nr:hypothetical protein [Marinifilaceae bacterium]